VKLDPQEPDYYENLGWALSTRGEHAKAFRNVEVAIRLRPKDAELYWKRGVIMGGWDGTAGRLTIFRQRSR
jgi:Flp pilus assembly protein TadD